jgi:hypothetical protein
MVKVRRIRPDEVEELGARAKKDDHEVVLPTHVVLKNGEIVGYLSVGAVPLVHLLQVLDLLGFLPAVVLVQIPI